MSSDEKGENMRRQISQGSQLSAHSLNEADNSVYVGEENQDEEEDADDEVDLDKTKEGLWSLLTGQY